MILLRHGQSEFNLAFTQTRKDPGIPDPKLTPLGHDQAAAAAEALAGHGLRRILASPYTRTLETAAVVARRLDLPIVINPIVRERCAFTCDIGSPRARLAEAWPQHDFSHIDEIWWPQTAEPAENVVARATLFRAEMAALPDWSDTLVVSHWGFIMSLTGLSVQNGEWLRVDPTEAHPEHIPWKHP
jgi:broad specificity phosphatase PhoE